MPEPVGTRDWRVTRAIHLNYTTDMTKAEIGEAKSGIKIEREVVEAAEDALEAMDNGQSSN